MADTRLTRITLDALDLLQSRSEHIQCWTDKVGETSDAFAESEVDDAITRSVITSAGDFVLDPLEVVDRTRLADLAADMGMSHQPEIVELYVLGAMQISLMSSGRMVLAATINLALADAIGVRSVQLLQAHPELAHPALHVPRYSARFGHRSLMAHTLTARPRLDADQLEQAVVAQPVLGRLIRDTLQSQPEASPFNEMSFDGGSPKLLGSLLRVAPELLAEFGKSDNLLQLAELCAKNATTQRIHTELIGFLDELKNAQAAQGLPSRFQWAVNGKTVMTTTGMSWASVRTSHPVLAFFYESALTAATLSGNHKKQLTEPLAAGFPGSVLMDIAERLDALMAQGCRVAPSAIPPAGLLELLALAPVAAQNQRAITYWAQVKDDAGIPSHASLLDLVEWAVQRTDRRGRQLQLQDFDRMQDVYLSSIGTAMTNRIRSGLVEREMSKALDTQAEAAPAPGPRRNRSL